MNLAQKKQEFSTLVRQDYGQDRTYVTRQEVLALRSKYNLPTQTWLKDPELRLGRGQYKLPGTTIPFPQTGEQELSQQAAINNVVPISDGLVPPMDPTFVPFGAYEDVRDIIRSGIFFPTFITGPTRSGKTLIPLQICAEEKRHLYRVNFTVETDESDLLGGYRLINGDTVWEDGPAILAAEDPAGAILLLDEISLGDSKSLCLQPLLEGNGIYLKKQKRWVYPSKRFNIIATDNTKGRGADSGKYIGTNVMNEAMLERFAVTYEQGYPEMKKEKIILKKNLEKYNVKADDFVECLCQWAENIRKTFDAGGADEQITTGRLVHIIKAYCIFGRNRIKAIRQAIARFDTNTQVSFLDTYTKIDANAKDEPDSPGEAGMPDLPHHKTSPTRRPW